MSHTKAKDVVEKKHRAWGMPSDEPTNFPTEDELRKFVDEINKQYKEGTLRCTEQGVK
jgi:hypothetical protein